MVELVLASASPRRLALLAQIGLTAEVAPADIDESALAGENDHDYVKRLAHNKAEAVAVNYPDSVVVAADTVISLDGRLLGKPDNMTHAIEIWRALSGRTHLVLTAVAVRDPRQRIRCEVCASKVSFCVLDEQSMVEYWHSGEPRDKAGAYAVQGLAAQWISRIEGSYSGIMGLPLYETAQLLKQAGIKTLL